MGSVAIERVLMIGKESLQSNLSWQYIFNPRRACAARVTVLALCVCVCLSVCVFVCYRSSSYSIRFNLQRTASAVLL